MAKAVASNVAQVAAELTKAGVKVEPESLTRLAEELGRAFQVRTEEVAILVLAQGGKFLKFILPQKLGGIGQIPLTSTSALAARTARDKRPEIVNHFPGTPHASVFEAVPLGEERSDPIQKIMSTPILHERKVIGVLQVSRKGKNPSVAGPDFGPSELGELIAAAEAIAPCIRLCIPE